MPRHDYQCPDCSLTIERPEDPTDPTVWCPYCAAGKILVRMEKLPSAPNFTIKGYSEKNGYSK